MPILEHTQQITDQFQHQNGPTMVSPPPPVPTHVSKPPEEPTKPHGATRLDSGRRLQGRTPPTAPRSQADTPKHGILLQPIRAAGRATVCQPEPSPYGAKYMEEEEERLDLSKGKERFRKVGFDELSSQKESKPIPFAPVSGDRRKRVGNGRRAAGRMQWRWIPVRLHPEIQQSPLLLAVTWVSSPPVLASLGGGGVTALARGGC